MERGSLTEALRETLVLFEEGGAPQTTTEVADRLDLGRRSTYERLERLVENGQLDTKKVGGNGRVWWRPSTDSTDSSLTSPGDEKSVRATTDFTDKGQQFELLVDAASEYAIFLLDLDGRVLTWNEGAQKIKGYDGEEIVGKHFSRFYTDDDRAASVPDRNLAAAIDQGHVEDEGWRVQANGSRFWATVTITALRDETGELTGFAKITRDMTGQRERERQLRRERDLVERVFETSPVGLGILTPDGLERVNARAAEIYGSATSDVDDYVVGKPEVYDSNGRKVPLDERPNARVFETGDSVYGWECQLEAADGVRRWLSVSASPLTGRDGAVERVVVATEDITRLKERARILERKRNALETELDEVFERVDDAFVALDDEWRITHLNEEAEHLLQRTKKELLGRVVSEEFPEIVGSTFEREFKRAMETQDAVTVEEFYPPLDGWLEVHAYPTESGLSVYFRDVSEQRTREQEVAEYETIVETMRDGVYVLDEEFRFEKVNDAYCGLTGYAREDLIGAHSSLIVGDDITQESADRLQEAIARGGGATLEADILRSDGSRLRAESNFTALPGSDAGAPRKIGVVRDVSERVEREREQRRQREQLAALNDVNDLVQEITTAAINQSTREEIKELVCAWLAGADSYESAWIGELDASQGLVTVREKAGLGGEIDAWQIQLDDSNRSNGPTGTAFRTSEVQVTQNLLEDSNSAPDHDYARASGSRSAAAIPLAYDGMLYGVLTVYSARPDAFAPAESRVFERLGTTLGHLIRAVEQRRALMATEVVQLDLQLTDILSYVSSDVDWSGQIEVDRTIPTRDGSYVQYVTATPDAVDALSALAEFGGAITELEELGISDKDVRFAVHYERPPLTEAIVQNAGRVVSAVMTDGDMIIRAEFPSDANIGAIIAQIEATYPQIQMIAQRSSISIDDRNERGTKTVFGELTERQRASIEAAYFAGFFDWPRKTTGEELAETMGVSSPTFHQHLRKATNTILSSLLSSDKG